MLIFWIMMGVIVELVGVVVLIDRLMICIINYLIVYGWLLGLCGDLFY